MKKTRNEKLLVILILLIVITGMSLGFSAFSKVLTITSKATIKPNYDDFQLDVYGLVSEQEAESFVAGTGVDFKNWSTPNKDTGEPGRMLRFDTDFKIVEDNDIVANINYSEANISITNVHAKFFTEDSYYFLFAIQNNTEYDVNLKFSSATMDILETNFTPLRCTPVEGEQLTTIPSDWCSSFTSSASMVLDKDGKNILRDMVTLSGEGQNGYELSKGGNVIFFVWEIKFDVKDDVQFGEGLSNGFNVTFNDLSLEIASIG